MKKAMKIVALLLSFLMLVTMATACKNADDDVINLGPTGDGSSFNDGTDDPNAPGTNTPGTDTPGSNTPGSNTPGSNTPGSNTPGSNTPGSNTPGSNTPGNTNPGVPENPDANKQEQDKIVQEFDATKKYDFASNPLFAESKPINHGVEPSFDIDTTGFVKNNIKVADLKGKKLTMITALERSNFIYYGENGETLNEWTWFDSLKKTYGLNFKYIESRFDKSPQQVITYMNAGKDLDIVPTHRAAFPQFLLLAQPLNPYVNLQYVDNSPGIDFRTMEQTKWNDGYICISPIGAVDVLWYNETMTKTLGLQDPHTLWKQNKWTWEAWENYVVGAPKTAPNGQTTLTMGTCSEGDAVIFFPRSNGVNVFEIVTENGKSKFVSNFEDPRAMEAWEFFSSVGKSLDGVGRRTSGDPQDDMYELGSVIMQGTTYLMRDYNYEYAKTQEFNWVPWPGKTADQCMCMNYGNAMMIPKKVKNKSNIPYAVKLMEIWANRFTEAINDYLQEPYYNFSYAERVEYFDFAAKTNYFGVGTRIFDVLSGTEKDYYNKFIASFYKQDLSTAATATQLYNLVDKAMNQMLQFGT